MNKLQAFLVALPALFVLAFKVSAAVGAFGSCIEQIGIWRTWGTWVRVGKKFEAIGTDFPKLLEEARPWLVRFGVKGLGALVVFLLAACGAAALSPKEAQLGVIAAGCKVSLDLERDAGAAGAEGDTERGCEAALRTLDPVKVSP